jgi:membrane-associated phospholipid phosphatase
MRSVREERRLRSTGASNAYGRVSAAGRSGAAFVAVLILAVLWPSPVLWINEAVGGGDLGIDERSFLGREAPSWDIAFWCIAGLLAIAMLHTARDGSRKRLREAGNEFRLVWTRIPVVARSIGAARLAAAVLGAASIVAAIWILLDATLVGYAELLGSAVFRTAIRLTNRFGGGMNPPLVILWFLLAGILYAERRWTRIAVAMVFASATAGTVVQAIKYLFGRTRPELWLGPFHHAGPPSTSFPSGHTVGAFAIATVILFGARSRPLRAAAMILACSVALSRVLAFRHWPSDVVASAMIGMMAGWFFVRCAFGGANGSEDRLDREE